MGHTADEGDINTAGFFVLLAQGDRKAVSRLYREHAGFMLDYVAKTKRRHGLAASEWVDAVHDVFVTLLNRPPDLDPTRDIGPLLLTMSLNAARDLAKKARRRTKNEAAAGLELLRTAAGAEAVGSRLVAADNKRFVETKLERLSPDDRQALVAYSADGPNRHVVALAASAGVEKGTAQMRFSRAKVRWAKLLNEGERRDAR